jgi:hypothetical protein
LSQDLLVISTLPAPLVFWFANSTPVVLSTSQMPPLVLSLFEWLLPQPSHQPLRFLPLKRGTKPESSAGRFSVSGAPATRIGLALQGVFVPVRGVWGWANAVFGALTSAKAKPAEAGIIH